MKTKKYKKSYRNTVEMWSCIRSSCEECPNNKGITLIALVLTIIILLILAGVTLSLVIGPNGILEKAKSAVEQSKIAGIQEEVELLKQSELAGYYKNYEQNRDKTIGQYLREQINGKTTSSGAIISDNGNGTSTYTDAKGEEKIVVIDDEGRVTIKEKFNAEEWDKTATSEEYFIWGSDTEGEEGYNTVIGYTEDVSTLTILKYPARCKVITMGVGSQGENSRAFVSNIRKVELPGTVVEIGSHAFVNDQFGGFNLDTITIPESVTSIGSSAFSGCSSLTSITIPSSITSIELDAFQNCSSLERININKRKNSILGSPWGASEQVVEWLTDPLTDFDAEKWDRTAADQDCFIWASNVEGEEGYGTVIGYTRKVESYTKLRFPSRCTEINFELGLNYQDGDEVLDTETSRSFTNNILKLEIPATVRLIGEWAIGGGHCGYSFQKLESVVIEEGMMSRIDRYAFLDCKSLKSITIPGGVFYIDNEAFSGCTSLQTINFRATGVLRNDWSWLRKYELVFGYTGQ